MGVLGETSADRAQARLDGLRHGEPFSTAAATPFVPDFQLAEGIVGEAVEQVLKRLDRGGVVFELRLPGERELARPISEHRAHVDVVTAVVGACEEHNEVGRRGVIIVGLGLSDLEGVALPRGLGDEGDDGVAGPQKRGYGAYSSELMAVFHDLYSPLRMALYSLPLAITI